MATFDEMDYYDKDALVNFDYAPPEKWWMDSKPDFRPGTWIYAGKAKHLEYLSLPNPRDWSPADYPQRDPGAARQVPHVQDLHGHLRALWCLRR
jgi:hypothetical protein